MSSTSRVALLAAAVGCAACQSQPANLTPQPRATFALKGARVLDVESGTYSAPAVVLVRGGSIQRVLPEAEYTPQLADTTIDLSGKYLLPGLIDAHVHLALGGPVRANALADLRAGFTTVVDLGSLTHRMLRIRDSINAGLIPGPRVLAAGIWVGIKGGVCEFNGIGIPGDTAAFRQRIRENVAAGADLIKLCVSGWPAESYANPDRYQLSDEVFAASVDEAHKHGKLIVAHDLSRGGVVAALRAHVDGLAHAAFVDAALADQLRAAGVFMIPTLASLTSGDTSEVGRALTRSVAIAHRQGVRLVFGTDAGAAPHGKNAEEFVALNRAGLSPIEAIRAATVTAAAAFRLSDSLGVIRKGMRADLLATDIDPLNDLEALQTPRFVMSRGSPVLPHNSPVQSQ